MPYIIAAIGVIAAVYFFVMRARNAAAMTQDIAGVADDILAAARRFGFRRRLHQHPVEDVDDPSLAIAGIGAAFLQIGGTPTQEQRDALEHTLRQQFSLSKDAVTEIDVLGQWLVNECNGPHGAIPRLTKRLVKIGGPEQFEPLMEVLGAIAKTAPSGLSAQQKEALEDVKRAFHIR